VYQINQPTDEPINQGLITINPSIRKPGDESNMVTNVSRVNQPTINKLINQQINQLIDQLIDQRR
jgi:hypothetical protein